MFKNMMMSVAVVLATTMFATFAFAKAVDKVALAKATEKIEEEKQYVKEKCGATLTVTYDSVAAAKTAEADVDSKNAIENNGGICAGLIRTLGDLCDKSLRKESEAAVFKEAIAAIKNVSCVPTSDKKDIKGRFDVSGSTLNLKWQNNYNQSSDFVESLKAAF